MTFSLRLLPYKTIEAASTGDVIAVEVVLRHYAGYIAKLSMRTLCDAYGTLNAVLDEDVRCDVESALIAGVLAFRAG